jgi:hypothetical protein
MGSKASWTRTIIRNAAQITFDGELFTTIADHLGSLAQATREAKRYESLNNAKVLGRRVVQSTSIEKIFLIEGDRDGAPRSYLEQTKS